MSTISQYLSQYVQQSLVSNSLGLINVKSRQFGAKGDGTTDDSSAIQTANNYADDNGGILLFPPGIYLIKDNVIFSDNVTLLFTPGAVIKTNSTEVITGTNTIIDAGIQQIFNLSSGGTISGSWNIEKVYPQWFGAKGDGITDDRQSIQYAIDFLNAEGGKIIIPFTGNAYILNSEHPSHVGHALYINKINVIIESNAGEVDKDTFRLTKSSMTSVIYCSGNVKGLQLTNLSINANDKADYAVYQPDATPYINIRNCILDSANLACGFFNCFVSEFTKVQFVRSNQDGLYMNNGVPVTSITFNSCYALNNVRYGYYLGFVTYSCLNACAADNNAISYYIANGYGITLNACGAESSLQAIKSTNGKGIVILGFYMFQCGSTSPGSPTTYLFEFLTAESTVLSGIILSNDASRYYTYKLGSLGSGDVSVLDDSIKKAEIYQVANVGFTTPIKLVRDEINVDISESVTTITPQAFYDKMIYLSNRTINNVYTLTLSAGIEPYAGAQTVLKNIAGSGMLIIQGTATRTDVKLNCYSIGILLQNIQIPVIFKNLTFDSSTNGTNTLRVMLNNCKDITFDNCLFEALVSSGGNHGRPLLAENSKFKFINGTETDDASGVVWNQEPWYSLDTASEFKLIVSATPITGFWDKGIRFEYPTPNSLGYIGGICTIKGEPGTWKDYGAIT